MLLKIVNSYYLFKKTASLFVMSFLFYFCVVVLPNILKSNLIMKRNLFFLFFILVGWQCALAQTFTSGPLFYSITSPNTVKVVRNTNENPSGVITIPSQVTNDGNVYSVTLIDERAFFACNGLTSVTIPNSVTSIGNQAFFICSNNLTTVIMGDSVTSIGNEAFAACYSLSSITLSNSLTTINYGAFMGCSALTSITIPNSVTSIGPSVFQSSGLTSITVPNSVTSMGEQVFYACTNLTSATISNSLTSIPWYTFFNCSSLTSFTIPSSITSIGFSVFSGCSSLTSFTIPNTVTSWGNLVFDGCTNLSSVTIPNTLTDIPYATFRGCTSLTSFIIPNSVTFINGNAFEGCSGLTSIICNAITPISIPNNVFTGVSQSACSLTVPNASVAAYQAAAIWQNFAPITCNNSTVNTTSVTACDSYTWSVNDQTYSTSGTYTNVIGCNTETLVLTITPSTFNTTTASACGSYTWSVNDQTYSTSGTYTKVTGCNTETLVLTITPSTSNTTTASASCSYTWANNNQTYTSSGLYSGLTVNCVTENLNLTITAPPTNFSSGGINYVVTSPTTVSVVGGNSIGAVVIPDSVTTACGTYSVTSISDYAFYPCPRLTSVTIGNSVTSIGYYAFKDCSSLTSVTIGTSVTSIGNFAFATQWSLISSIICNSSIPPPINWMVFNGSGYSDNCTLTVPDASIAAYRAANTWNSFLVLCVNQTENTTTVTTCGSYTWSVNGQTYLKSGTYKYYTGCLTEILVLSIPITSGGINYELTSPTTLSVGRNASATGAVVIPASVTNSCGTYAVTGISEYAFEYTSITSVTLPNSITSIGNRAFRDCSSLTSINLPNSITSIVEGAFKNCSSLTSVTIPNSVTTINVWTFYGCSGLTSVTLPNSITRIDEGAFSNNSNLTSFVVPNSVTSIGKNVFEYCNNLSTVTLPNSLTSIGDYAFQWSGLTSVVIPNQITRINTGVFNYCRNLQYITIPNSVTSIGATAFTRLESLITIFCNAITPPTVNHDAFWATSYAGRGLIVPNTSLAAYRAADIWRYFAPINCANPTVNTTTITAYNTYTWSVNGQTYTTNGTYSLVTECETKNLNLTILAQPAPPTGLSCFEVAVWNQEISDYEIFADLPVAPTVNCYQSTEWDDTTCSWIISGTQPDAPLLSCSQTATWNATTCEYDIVTTIPAIPSTACYQSAVWNYDTCLYDITGTQPAQPSLSCYETATWNAATCEWDVIRDLPSAPQVDCYQTVAWNESICDYVVTGSMPDEPVVNCYETATWNATSCQYDITGNLPEEPTLLCYQRAIWNASTCNYDIAGEKPSEPAVACYETATWNGTTCVWDITGTQPVQPVVACYQTATFDTLSCSWVVTGTQPLVPTLACYETASWNSDSCQYDIIGTQPAAPTSLLCYQTATFNTSLCSWVVTGSQPKITSISGAGAICNGTSKTLTLASGTFGSIQWQSSTTSATATDFTNISGATNPVLLTVTPAVTTWYRAYASFGTCPSATSSIVAVTVSQPTAVGTLSALSPSICTATGTNITLSAATGTIAWQKATVTNGVTGSFTTVTGNTSTSLATGNLTTSTAYKVIVSSGACASSSTQTIITVSPKAVAKTISGAGAICNGMSKTLTLGTGSVGIIQWQSSTTSATATDFATIDGATNPVSLTVSPNVTTWYRVVASSGTCAPATSAAVAVTVSQPTAVGTLSALNATLCKGTGTTITLSDAIGTIAWQKATVTNGLTGSFTTVAGNTSTSLATGNLTTSTAYRVIVSSGACSTSTSQTTIITVSPLSVAKTISGAGAICRGTSKTLTLVAGSVGAIQWQSSTTSATATDFANIDGATNPVSLAVSPNVTSWYRIVASSGACSSATSAAVAVKVSQPTAVGTLSALYSTVCTGTPTTITLSSAVGTIAWQKATVTNGVTGTFTTVTGNTTTLTTGNLTAKTAYKVIVSNGVCATSSSLPIVITVNPAAKATAITGFNTVTTPVCVGASQTLTLSAGYVGTIEWLIANTLNGTYTVIPGATGSTYDYFPSSTAVKYFKVRLTSSPCSTTQTSAVGVKVYAKNCAIVAPTTSKVELADNTLLDVKAYPNPFVNSFRLDLKTSNTELIKISLYDMTGRLIEVNEVEPSTVNTLEIGNTFPTGVYNLILTQGENTKVIRVIKR